MKKEFDKKNLLTKGVIILLCLFFVGGIAWGANSVLELEGVYDPYIPAQSLSPFPDTAEKAVAYINSAIAAAEMNKIKLTASQDFSIGDEPGDVSGNNELTVKSAEYLREDIQDCVKEGFEEKTADYGEGFSGLLLPLELNSSDVAQYSCEDTYFECPICANKQEEDKLPCKECDGTLPLIKKLHDEYTITFELSQLSPGIKKYFDIVDDNFIDGMIAEKSGAWFDCTAPEKNNVRYIIVAKINRLTDRLISLELKKEAEVKATLSFKGEYAFLSQAEIGLAAASVEKYEFSWPGITLSEHEVSIDPGKTETLSAALNCDDPTAYTVKWSTSDESVASVDTGGTVKATRHRGKVTITAEFVFNSVTYTDTCEVYVKDSVESIDISKRSLELKPGESFRIEASVSPKKATVQTVTWYTSDEAVATVDGNGNVTAVGEGTADVFAVSDDGKFKATCKVEVAM